MFIQKLDSSRTLDIGLLGSSLAPYYQPGTLRTFRAFFKRKFDDNFFDNLEIIYFVLQNDSNEPQSFTLSLGEAYSASQTSNIKKIVYGLLTGFLLIAVVFVFLHLFFSSLALISGFNSMRLSYLNKHYPIVSSREIKPLDRPCVVCAIPLIGYICREIPTDEFAVHDHCIEDWIKLFDMGVYAEVGKEGEAEVVR